MKVPDTTTSVIATNSNHCGSYMTGSRNFCRKSTGPSNIQEFGCGKDLPGSSHSKDLNHGQTGMLWQMPHEDIEFVAHIPDSSQPLNEHCNEGRSFQYFVENENGINLIVDLNSTLLTYIGTLAKRMDMQFKSQPDGPGDGSTHMNNTSEDTDVGIPATNMGQAHFSELFPRFSGSVATGHPNSVSSRISTTARLSSSEQDISKHSSFHGTNERQVLEAHATSPKKSHVLVTRLNAEGQRSLGQECLDPGCSKTCPENDNIIAETESCRGGSLPETSTFWDQSGPSQEFSKGVPLRLYSLGFIDEGEIVVDHWESDIVNGAFVSKDKGLTDHQSGKKSVSLKEQEQITVADEEGHPSYFEKLTNKTLERTPAHGSNFLRNKLPRKRKRNTRGDLGNNLARIMSMNVTSARKLSLKNLLPRRSKRLGSKV